MLLPEYVPVLDLKRGETVDQRFFGMAALYGFKEGKLIELFKIGNDNNYPFFLRSLLKPIQASIMADYGTVKHYGFTDKEVAIMQASHAGEKVHTDLVLSILKWSGLTEDYLKCPVIPPLCPDVLSENETPRAIHNNCSAKHAMMLAVSKQLGFSLDDYCSPSHSLQKIILDKICELSEYCGSAYADNYTDSRAYSGIEENQKTPPQSFDGCGVPVWALPFENIARAFFKLYNEKKYAFLKNAYMENPYIIGGKDVLGLRQDTHIMLLNPDLISKTGAGGFLSVYNDKKNEFLLVKMAQDNNKARFLFTMKILEKLNWIENNVVDYNFYDELKRAVGKYSAHVF